MENCNGESDKIKSELCDLEYTSQWMGYLKKEVRKLVPIIHLAIPGISMPVSFEENQACQKPTNNTSALLQAVSNFLPQHINFRNSSNCNIALKLMRGVRYMSFHVAHADNFCLANLCNIQEEEEDNVQGCEDLCDQEEKQCGTDHINQNAPKPQSNDTSDECCPKSTYPHIEDILMCVKNFLDQFPDEFVILDFTSFNNMLYSNHLTLQELLFETFGAKAYTRLDGKLKRLTLKKAKALGKQVMIIYRLPRVDQYFWTDPYWPIDSPKTTTKYTNLEEFLSTKVYFRNLMRGHILKYSVEPDPQNCLMDFWRNLFGAFNDIGKKAEDWVVLHRSRLAKAQQYAKINVLVMDHLSVENSVLPLTIISINWRLNPGCHVAAPASEMSKTSQTSKGSQTQETSQMSKDSFKSELSTNASKDITTGRSKSAQSQKTKRQSSIVSKKSGDQAKRPSKSSQRGSKISELTSSKRMSNTSGGQYSLDNAKFHDTGIERGNWSMDRKFHDVRLERANLSDVDKMKLNENSLKRKLPPKGAKMQTM